VTGGNVSLYNETRLPDGQMQPIHPPPVVGMVGLVSDLTRVRGLAWCQAGDAIWLLGVPLDSTASEPDERVSLAGSSYLERIHGAVTGRPPLIDLQLEKRVQAFLRQAIAEGLVASAHDLSDGGLAVAVAEACIASGLGAALELPAGALRPDRLLFAEGGARVLVSIAAADAAAWQQALDQAAAAGAAIPAQCLGAVQAGAQAPAALTLSRGGATLLSLPVDDLGEAFEQAIPRRLGQAVPPSA
jgi:phosphoribosylformylglycinamidine synthase